jgi:hypothetical protein
VDEGESCNQPARLGEDGDDLSWCCAGADLAASDEVAAVHGPTDSSALSSLCDSSTYGTEVYLPHSNTPRFDRRAAGGLGDDLISDLVHRKSRSEITPADATATPNSSEDALVLWLLQQRWAEAPSASGM